MKTNRLLLFLCAICSFFKSQTAIAQITVSVSDTLPVTACKVPGKIIFDIGGTVVGTTSTKDTVTIKINFGDGTDTTYTKKVFSGMYSIHVTHDYTYAGSFVHKVTAYSPFGDSAIKVRPFPYIVTTTCATLSGKLYLDVNGDCAFNTGEPGISHFPFYIINTATSDTSWGGWSDTGGNYSISMPAGTYTIMPKWWRQKAAGIKDTLAEPTCPASGLHTLTVASSSSYTKDFGYECAAKSQFDARISVFSPGFVPGDTACLRVVSGSSGFDPLKCAKGAYVAALALHPKLKYIGYKGIAPTSVSGSVITWALTGPYIATDIYVITDTTVKLGDSICNTASIAPPASVPDPFLPNNTFEYCRKASSSFDPNCKEVAPNGDGAPGYIDDNTPLTYTVHFQNTGTAPAKNVTITDVIDADLDITTLHLMDALAPVNISRTGNTVKFRFENINLPDSGSDYQGSMGSVTYGIMTKQGLAPGTKMTNKAAIYFDYNDPIITNEVLNTIKFPISVQHIGTGKLKALIYPNPAGNELTVKPENNSEYSVTIMDMAGRVEVSIPAATGSTIINTVSLPAGTHMVTIKDNKGNQLNTKVVIQH